MQAPRRFAATMHTIVLVGVLKEGYILPIISKATASTKTELQRRSISHQAKPREKLREGGLVVVVVEVEVEEGPAPQAEAAVKVKTWMVRERRVAGAREDAREPVICAKEACRIGRRLGSRRAPTSTRGPPPLVSLCCGASDGGGVRCVGVCGWG